jgi:hypothetical protein
MGWDGLGCGLGGIDFCRNVRDKQVLWVIGTMTVLPWPPAELGGDASTERRIAMIDPRSRRVITRWVLVALWCEIWDLEEMMLGKELGAHKPGVPGLETGRKGGTETGNVGVASQNSAAAEGATPVVSFDPIGFKHRGHHEGSTVQQMMEEKTHASCVRCG